MTPDEFEALCRQVHVAGWRLAQVDAASETADFEVEEGGRVTVRGVHAVQQLAEMGDARTCLPPLARAFGAAVLLRDVVLTEERVIGLGVVTRGELDALLRAKTKVLETFEDAARPVAAIGQIALAEWRDPDSTSGKPN